MIVGITCIMWHALFEENMIWEEWDLIPREGGREDGGGKQGGDPAVEGAGPSVLLCQGPERIPWKKEIGGQAQETDWRCPNPGQLIKRVGMCFQKLLCPHPQNWTQDLLYDGHALCHWTSSHFPSSLDSWCCPAVQMAGFNHPTAAAFSPFRVSVVVLGTTS